MRLSEQERQTIREAVADVYGPTAVVRLFGSHRDDLKGGDIDLHVEADDIGREDFPSRRSRLWALLQRRLGDRRIDILQSRRGRTPKAIERIAYRDGAPV